MKKTSLLLALAAALGIHCGSIGPNDCEPDKHFCYDNRVRLCNSKGDDSILKADCSLNKVYNTCGYEGKRYECLNKVPICQATIKGIFEASIESKKPSSYFDNSAYSCQGRIVLSYFPPDSEEEGFNFNIMDQSWHALVDVNVPNLSQIIVGKDYPLSGDVPFRVSATLRTGTGERRHYINISPDDKPSGFFILSSMGKEFGEKWSFEFSGQLYTVFTAEEKIDLEVKASGILAPDFESSMYDF